VRRLAFTTRTLKVVAIFLAGAGAVYLWTGRLSAGMLAGPIVAALIVFVIELRYGEKYFKP
jgi:hypothetical protein